MSLLNRRRNNEENKERNQAAQNTNVAMTLEDEEDEQLIGSKSITKESRLTVCEVLNSKAN